MSWKVGDLCVVKSKQFGWTNCEVKQLNKNVAKVEFLEFDGVEEINISELKLFGPSAVNKKGDFVKSENTLDARDYDGWKVSLSVLILLYPVRVTFTNLRINNLIDFRLVTSA